MNEMNEDYYPAWYPDDSHEGFQQWDERGYEEPEDKQIQEQQTYGITIAQVASCINNHGGDHLEYAGSIARAATNQLAMLAAAGKFTHDQLQHLENIKLLLNRITLAEKLQTQATMIEQREIAQ